MWTPHFFTTLFLGSNRPSNNECSFYSEVTDIWMGNDFRTQHYTAPDPIFWNKESDLETVEPDDLQVWGDPETAIDDSRDLIPIVDPQSWWRILRITLFLWQVVCFFSLILNMFYCLRAEQPWFPEADFGYKHFFSNWIKILNFELSTKTNF